MRKRISIVLALLCLLILSLQAYGYEEKAAVKSDIKAYIDYTPIDSYNIDGYTYVVAEELMDYGFNVIYYEEHRYLVISRNPFATPVYRQDEMKDDEVGTEYEIYPTDIRVAFDGEIGGYNIGGRTIIQIDELAKCGEFHWDPDRREVSVTIYEHELKGLYDQAENKVDVSYTGDSSVTYNGQVNEEGNPHGIGYMEVNSLDGRAGVGYEKIDKIWGYFDNGVPSGAVFLNRHLGAGKIGESIDIKFIGKTDPSYTAERSFQLGEDGSSKKVVRENNFGSIPVPYHYMDDYVGKEVFEDGRIYSSGVWYESNGYRGQEGVTFRSWYNGTDYQSILRTELDEEGTVESFFEEIKSF